jgi:hypothetical protein
VASAGGRSCAGESKSNTTFLLKAGGGLYWLIPATVASLLGGVVNAWLFLVKVPS